MTDAAAVLSSCRAMGPLFPGWEAKTQWGGGSLNHGGMGPVRMIASVFSNLNFFIFLFFIEIIFH